MNILKGNVKLLSFILSVFFFIWIILFFEGKASAIADETYSKNTKCNEMIKSFAPKWAPKNGWHINCVNGTVDWNSKSNKNVLGITYPKVGFIFIRDDITDDHELQNVIIHEWTHAAVASYNLKNSSNWVEWSKYVNGLKGHSKGYYGKPEEVLAENTARCTLGYYYNFLSMDKARCSVIHKLFPEFTTVQDKYDFNE